MTDERIQLLALLECVEAINVNHDRMLANLSNTQKEVHHILTWIRERAEKEGIDLEVKDQKPYA